MSVNIYSGCFNLTKSRLARFFFIMANEAKKGFFKAFWDFFVLFSGVSTASNLARTQGRPLKSSGLFLFRKPASGSASCKPNPR